MQYVYAVRYSFHISEPHVYNENRVSNKIKKTSDFGPLFVRFYKVSDGRCSINTITIESGNYDYVWQMTGTCTVHTAI